jgi:hypothetical protein
MNRKKIKEEYKDVLRQYNYKKDLFQYYLIALKNAKHAANIERPSLFSIYDEIEYKTACAECRDAHYMLSSLQKDMIALKYKLKYYKMILNKKK